MLEIIENSLYLKDKKRFLKIEEYATSFNYLYNKNNIIQDDIYNVLDNYIKKNGMKLELIKVPVKDSELCACTFIRDNSIFVMINSIIPLSKQIFATAHELYHIYCFFEKEDDSLLRKVSYIDSEMIEENKEDIEANAFAGCLLAPKDRLDEQIGVYNIKFNKNDIKSILKIMDIFAIPFKAAVLRLLEENVISKKTAETLLLTDNDVLQKEVELTGISKRWNNSTENEIKLGNLKELMYHAKDFVSNERFSADKNRIEKVIVSFSE